MWTTDHHTEMCFLNFAFQDSPHCWCNYLYYFISFIPEVVVRPLCWTFALKLALANHVFMDLTLCTKDCHAAAGLIPAIGGRTSQCTLSANFIPSLDKNGMLHQEGHLV